MRARRGARSSGFGDEIFRTPVPGQRLVDPPGQVIPQSGEHVCEPSLRIDAVALGGLDQRANERAPALEAVIYRLGGLALSGELAALLAFIVERSRTRARRF
jgi:hypothetical protein